MTREWETNSEPSRRVGQASVGEWSLDSFLLLMHGATDFMWDPCSGLMGRVAEAEGDVTTGRLMLLLLTCGGGAGESPRDTKR